MMGHAVCRVLANGVELNHARHFNLGVPRSGVARWGGPREFFKGLTRHAILLTDANRLQPAASNITAHRPDLEPEAFRDLFERIQAIMIRHLPNNTVNTSKYQQYTSV